MSKLRLKATAPFFIDGFERPVAREIWRLFSWENNMQSFISKLSSFVVTVLCLSSLTLHPSQADDQTAKALIGSVISVIAAEATKEASADEKIAQEDIQWNEPESDQNDQPVSMEDEETHPQNQTPEIQQHAVQEQIIPSSSEDVKAETGTFEKITDLVLCFAFFFGVFLLIGVIKKIIAKGDEYDLRLIISPQFFIILLGTPFAFIVHMNVFPDAAANGEGLEFYMTFLPVMLIPTLAAFAMTARKSNVPFALAYTAVQIISIPCLIGIIAFVKARKDAYDEKRGYR